LTDTEKPAQPGTPMVLAADAKALAAGFVVPADAAPIVEQPSSSDDNVGRARRRRDALSPEVIADAHKMLVRELAAQARAPFRRVLAELIGARPTPEAIRRFADKYPDRWAQAVSIMGGLAGYERGVVEVNVFNIKGLSDADLVKRLAEVEKQLGEQVERSRAPRVTGPVVDAEVVSSDSVSPASPAADPNA
jgi:hypothetical protein